MRPSPVIAVERILQICPTRRSPMNMTKPIFRCLMMLMIGMISGRLVTSQSAVAQNFAYTKYERAMIFSGGGFQTAMFLGMLEGAELANHRPDVIVGSCGGSIAAAIANALPSNKERYEFIGSREFYDVMHRPEIANGGLFAAMAKVGGMVSRRIGIVRSPPAIFSGTVMNVPMDIGVEILRRPFYSFGIRAVILAAQLEVDQQPGGLPVLRRGKNMKQVFFTDSATGSMLYRFSSPIAQAYPSSALHYETEVMINHTLARASRAGISDPYYMEPMEIDGRYYLTGAVDLYPLETGKRLANEVTMVYPGRFDTLVEANAFASTFRYSANDRRVQVTRQYADHWIDASDVADLYSKVGFNPQPDFKKWRITDQVPQDYNEFRRRIYAQWEYGRDRALEAFKKPLNHKGHIRKNTLANQIEAALQNPQNRKIH
jgi:hypothetical protein